MENSSLFWWIKPEDKLNISLDAVVEAVLNYGNEKSVKKLFDLIEINKVADIFYRQISGKRSNYNKRTKIFSKSILKDMHSEVLINQQRELLPLIKSFLKDYYLVGGTAIALHIGHRRSIDFDLFTTRDIKRKSIRNLIDKSGFKVENLLYDAFDQIHLVIKSVIPRTNEKE